MKTLQKNIVMEEVIILHDILDKLQCPSGQFPTVQDMHV